MLCGLFAVFFFRWRASQNVLRDSREIIALEKQVAVAHDWTSKQANRLGLKT